MSQEHRQIKELSAFYALSAGKNGYQGYKLAWLNRKKKVQRIKEVLTIAFFSVIRYFSYQCSVICICQPESG